MRGVTPAGAASLPDPTEYAGDRLETKRGVLVGWHNLWCPNCENFGVMISASEGGRGTNSLTSYTAQCGCGYSVPFLGSDGTIRKAVAEWKQLIRAAKKVKLQLLGAQKMKAEQLSLDVEAFIGTTPWIDGMVPRIEGWYDVRYKMTEEERATRGTAQTRRWWHGDAQCWSWPVEVGNSTEEDEAVAKAKLARVELTQALEWRGLNEQHPDMRLLRRR